VDLEVEVIDRGDLPVFLGDVIERDRSHAGSFLPNDAARALASGQQGGLGRAPYASRRVPAIVASASPLERPRLLGPGRWLGGAAQRSVAAAVLRFWRRNRQRLRVARNRRQSCLWSKSGRILVGVGSVDLGSCSGQHRIGRIQLI